MSRHGNTILFIMTHIITSIAAASSGQPSYQCERARQLVYCVSAPVGSVGSVAAVELLNVVGRVDSLS